LQTNMGQLRELLNGEFSNLIFQFCTGFFCP